LNNDGKYFPRNRPVVRTPFRGSDTAAMRGV